MFRVVIPTFALSDQSSDVGSENGCQNEPNVLAHSKQRLFGDVMVWRVVAWRCI